jgi:hypothetical protein
MITMNTHFRRRPSHVYTKINPSNLNEGGHYFVVRDPDDFPSSKIFPLFESAGNGRVFRVEDTAKKASGFVPDDTYNYYLIDHPIDDLPPAGEHRYIDQTCWRLDSYQNDGILATSRVYDVLNGEPRNVQAVFGMPLGDWLRLPKNPPTG